MIDTIFKAFWPQIVILAILYVMVLMMIAADLISGIRKAKRRGEYCSSYGLRKTSDKIARYYNMIFVLTVIDTVQMLAVWQFGEQTAQRLPMLPLLTFGGTIFVGLIELKSIYEKSDDKEKARAAETLAMLGKALKDRDIKDMVAAMMDYLKSDASRKDIGCDTSHIDRRFMAGDNAFEEIENYDT